MVSYHLLKTIQTKQSCLLRQGFYVMDIFIVSPMSFSTMDMYCSLLDVFLNYSSPYSDDRKELVNYDTITNSIRFLYPKFLIRSVYFRDKTHTATTNHNAMYNHCAIKKRIVGDKE